MTTNEVPFLGFDALFSNVGVLGHELSPKLVALDGQAVTMRGYLSPAGHEADGVLVLTRTPVASCSEGGEGHDWPDDAVFVFPADAAADLAPGRSVAVLGRLEHGLLRVAEANSLVRLRDAHWLPGEA
jgi:hypothetical protein